MTKIYTLISCILPIDIHHKSVYNSSIRRKQKSRRKHSPSGKNNVGAKIGKGAAKEAGHELPKLF